MKAVGARPGWRWAPHRAGAAVAGVLLSGAGLPAAAQPPGAAADAPAGSAAPAEAEAPYTDRLVDGGALVPDIGDADPSLAMRNAGGWPRTLSVELRRQAQRGSEAGRMDAAYGSLQATLDTPNHGALQLDVSRRLASSGYAGSESAAPPASVALSQRLVPLAGGWLGSHFLGDIYTLNTDLASRSLRQSLPTRLVQGAAGQWENRTEGLVLQWAAGRPGVAGNLGQDGLVADGPPLQVVGLQRSGASWAYAAQAADAGSAPSGSVDGELEGRSVWQSLRWQGVGVSAQAHLLASRSGEGRATGGWFDAGRDAGPVSHRLGAHRLPEGVHWLGLPVGGGTQGGYYRWRWHTRRDIVETQVDALRSLDDAALSRQFWLLARRQLDQSDAVGLQFSDLRSQGSASWQAFLFNDRLRGSGSWRWFAGAGRDAGGAHPAQAGFEWSDAWREVRWTSSAALQRQPEQERTLADLAASVSGPVTGRLSLDAGLRLVRDTAGAEVSRGVNAGAHWALGSGWSLSAALSADRSRAFVPASGPSGAPPPLVPDVPVSSVRYAWLSLRYDFAAGSPELPLGGSATSGGGRVEGVIYLDANANGRLDPSEQRAAGVTVVLDGRFAVRTDAQGRFDFPFVATGEHQLTVMNDTLPLPWHAPSGPGEGAAATPGISISVSARRTTRLEIGAVQGTD
jgi:hypothetical protein